MPAKSAVQPCKSSSEYYDTIYIKQVGYSYTKRISLLYYTNHVILRAYPIYHIRMIALKTKTTYLISLVFILFTTYAQESGHSKQANQQEEYTTQLKELNLIKGQLSWAHRVIYNSLDNTGKKLFTRYRNAFNSFNDYKKEYLKESSLSYANNIHPATMLESKESTPPCLLPYRPQATPEMFNEADAQLNAQYIKAMSHYKRIAEGIDTCNIYSISKATNARNLLRKAQRQWIIYRDAEASFFGYLHQSRYPHNTIITDIKTKLSLERAKELANENIWTDEYKLHNNYHYSLISADTSKIGDLSKKEYKNEIAHITKWKKDIQKAYALIGQVYPNHDWNNLEERSASFSFNNLEEERKQLTADEEYIKELTIEVLDAYNNARKVYTKEAYEKYDFLKAQRTDNKWLQAYYYLKGGPVAINRKKALAILNDFINTSGDLYTTRTESIKEIIRDINTSQNIDLLETCPCITPDGVAQWINYWSYRDEVRRAWIYVATEAALDAKGKQLFYEYCSTFQTYAEAHSKFIGGDSENKRLRVLTHLQKTHESTLVSLPQYRPKNKLSAWQVADKDLNEQYKTALKDHESTEDELRYVQRLWVKYRDAASAFFVHTFGAKFSPESVVTDIKTHLSIERVEMLQY
jgi:uncharacterized protein YecT (DUF1311 family)